MSSQKLIVGDHIHFLSGYPFSSHQFSNDDGLPLIRIRDITHNTAPNVFFSGVYDDTYLIKNNDVLIGMDGDFNIVRWTGGVGVLNQRVLKITEKPSSIIDLDFLFFFLEDYLPKLNTVTAATTVKHLSVKDLSGLEVRFPSKDIQKKIASVLISSNKQANYIKALIDKYTLIKQGMMADLFSRGIDTLTGQLRPSFEEAPELYHETDLGWLPKGWSTPTLESLLADVNTPMRSGPFGSALLKHELVKEGIPLLGIDNIFVEEFRSSNKRFVTAKKFQELSRYAVKPKDVVITIMGTVGRTCVVPDNIGRALSSKHLWTMTFDQARINPELVCWQLNYSEWVDLWFRKESQGGVMEAIQSQTLRQLNLVLPPEAEQKKIYEIYSTLNGRIGSSRRELAKLKLQKQGLMQDLLTGKVSVL